MQISLWRFVYIYYEYKVLYTSFPFYVYNINILDGLLYLYLFKVFIDELPDDEKDLLDLLRAEIAPLDIWHRFAVEYYRQGRKDAFREILKEAKNGFDQFEQKKLIGKEKAEFNEARLKIINGLAASLIFDLIEFSRSREQFSTIRTEILTYFTTADRYC